MSATTALALACGTVLLGLSVPATAAASSSSRAAPTDVVDAARPAGLPAVGPLAAAPGNPGVPSDPEVLFTEDFESSPDGSNVLLTGYTGAGGQTYAAAAFWSNRPNCNGFIVDWTSPRNANDCTGVPTAVAVYNAMLAIPHALGQLRGVPPTTNGAAASYTAAGANGAQIQFQTATPITLPVANRFVTFSVDAGAMNCNVSAPLLRFYLLDEAGTEIPVSSTPINVCTDPRGQAFTGVPTPSGAAQTVRAGSFAANGSTLVTGSTLGVRMRNQNSAANGNDGAYDNIEVLDVSPQLDKSFSPVSTVVGGSSRLTFTVTNTSELASKAGWAFTDNLPAGLVVASSPDVTNDCGATVSAAAGAAQLTVTGGTLTAGEVSCTVAVDVTSRTIGTYTNGPDSFFPTTGVNLPGEATVTFTPLVGAEACPTPAFLFQGSPSASPVEIDLVTGAQTTRPALANLAFNGVGYSELADGFFGFDNPTDELYFVSPDYSTVENLGSPDYSNVSFTYAQLFPSGIPIGDVSPDGVMYVSSGGGAGTQRPWMAIDVDQDSPTFLQVLDGGMVPAPGNPTNQGLDWVFNPVDGKLYSFGINTGNKNVSLYAFDPADASAGYVQVGSFGALTAPNGVPAVGNQATSSPFGATYSSPGYLYGANNQTGQIWRVAVDDPTTATFFAYGPGPSSNNDGARCASAPIWVDLGDAPDSYGTSLSEDGARHTLVDYDDTTHTAPLMLGDSNTVDAEDDGVPSPGADGDDLAGVDDEGAVDSPIVLTPASTTPVTVTATNETDQPATLVGWFDVDGDGTFETGERSVVPVPASSGSADYELIAPAGVVPDAFARFRLYAGDVADPQPTGAVSGGEVEDYPTTAGPPQCPVDAFLAQNTPTDLRGVDLVTGEVSNLGDDISGANLNALGFNPLDGYLYAINGNSTGLNRITTDGVVTGLGSIGLNQAAQWQTGDVDEEGHFWIAQGTQQQSVLRWAEVDLEPGSPTYAQVLATGTTPRDSLGLFAVSDWAYSLADGGLYTITNRTGTDDFVVVRFDTTSHDLTVVADLGVLQAPGQPALGANTPFGAIYADSSGNLYGSHNATGQIWRVNPTTLEATYFAPGPTSSGNDGARCVFAPVAVDLGDAPDSYGTTLAADGARHGLESTSGTTSLMLGASVDAEDDGVPGPGADGDDSTGSDDEDGVAGPIGLVPSVATTVTVAATNDTGEDATLSGWIDIDGDGTFDDDERAFVTVPAGSGTADYDLLFPAATVTTDTYARFRLFPGTVADPAPTGAAGDGEVEDYLVEVAEPELTIAKSVETDVPAEAVPGGTVTYTVTVANTGVVPYPVGSPASVTDDLGGVLDDATLDADSLAATSDGASTPEPPTVDGETLSWSGALEPGETVTLTYAVTVDDPPAGDGLLENAVTGPPESSCADGTEPGCSTDTPVRSLEVVKSVDVTEVVPGGTATYTVTVENTGQVDYTADAPASLEDDLAEVLDDATWADDVTADVGDVDFTEPMLSWSGALPVGETATITYSVTVDDPVSGDGDLVNAVTGPPESGCDDGTEDGCSTSTPVRALMIAKTADATEVVPGATVTYTVTVENTGQVDYTDDVPATFSDDLSEVLDDATFSLDDADADVGAVTYSAPNLAWTGPLAVGDVATVTYAVTVNDPATGDGLMDNAVTGPPESNCDTGDEDGCTTDTPVRALTVAKSVDPAGPVPLGATVAYTVTVQNTGQVDYAADAPASVTDDLTAVLDDTTLDEDSLVASSDGPTPPPTPVVDGNAVTWSGPLAVGETVTVTYTVTVHDALTGDGSLDNAVTGPPESGCDDGTEDGCSTSTPVRALSIAKIADVGEVLPGGTVTYTVTVENTGQGDYTADEPASFDDDLSEVLDDAAWEGTQSADVGEAEFADPTLSWSGPLPAGETATITYSVTVNDPLTGDGSLVNAVTGPPESGCDDGTEDGCTTDTPVRALAITKSAEPEDPVAPGGTVTYTVTVENTGQVDYTGDGPAMFTDDLTGVLDDATFSLEDADADVGEVTYSAPDLAWSGPLPAGETATITYTVTVDDPATGDGTLDNLVTGPPESGCDVGTEDGCSTSTPVRELAIAKSADVTEVVPGGSVTYTVTVENTGQADYTDDAPAAISDDLAGVLDDASVDEGSLTATSDGPTPPPAPQLAGDVLTWSGPLAVGETVTVTYVVTVADPATGDGLLDNAVTGPPESGCDDGTEDGCSTDTPVRALTIAKSADVASVGPGGTVTYTVTVENTGQVAYESGAPASFTDDLAGVVDDATVDETSLAASSDGPAPPPAPVLDGDALTWAGPLAVGETVTVTYAVTVNDPLTGDGSLANAVTGPPESGCDDGTEDGCSTDTPVRALALAKEATTDLPDEVLPGGTVTYTVMVTNTGQVAYTDDAPASFTDDLSAVLDDAAYGGDAHADSGTVTYADPVLTWTGPLAVGASVTVTYTVTVNDPLTGDGTLRNAVTGPPEAECVETCSTGVPVRALSVVKSVATDDPGAAVPGGVVTYTVTVTNTGQVAYTEGAPASFTDDLTDVLDDATWDDTATADVGTVAYAEPELAWSGPLAVGGTATVTYTVTVGDPDPGDGVLVNAVVGPPGSTCDEDSTAEQLADCTTSVGVRALEIVKSADQPDAVDAGGVLTYTVIVTNTGTVAYDAATPATFDDDLTDVLDDATYGDDASADVGAVAYAEPVLSWSGPLDVGGTATVTYSVAVTSPPSGDLTLANVVTGPPESTCPVPMDAALAALAADPFALGPFAAAEPFAVEAAPVMPEGCQVRTPVRAFALAKSVDVAVAEPGDAVAYEITVTSTGAAPYTADHPASFTDDLSDVLDDATWAGEASADAGTVDYAEPLLSWSGPLDVGGVATVTYTMTVDDDAGGDTAAGSLVNVVGPAGGGGTCEDDASCTTTTTVTPPAPGPTPDPDVAPPAAGPDLPRTGAALVAVLAWALAFLTGGLLLTRAATRHPERP
ncbi:DUF11 domain-containing protein [Cellulosimicrobium terreum]|nr:DUF11 domain-containing protein [Cellulosimicrobium terreum]